VGKWAYHLQFNNFLERGGGSALKSIPCEKFVTEYKSKRFIPEKEVSTGSKNDEESYILEVQTPEGWVCLDATCRMGSVA